MSHSFYKKVVVLVFTLFIIWGVLSLWGYISYYNSGSINDKYSLGISLIIEALAFTLALIAPRGTFTANKIGLTVVLWLVYVFVIVIATYQNLLMEIRAILWWPSIYILSCFIFRSKYSQVGFILFRDYFIPVAFIANTALFFYLSSLNSKGGLFFASNQVFYISLLLPALFLLKKRWMKYLGILIVVLCASISFKRSTLLITITALFFSVFFEMKGRAMKFSNLFVMATLVGASFYLFTYINNRSQGFILERINSIEDTGGSGRVDIYQSVVNSFSVSDTFEQIFGHGYNSVVKKGWAIDNGVEVSAHNDFLEVLIDFGIVGLLIYLFFFIQIIRNVFRTKKHKRLYQTNIILLVVFVVMSLVSHLVLYPTYFAYLIIIISLTQVSIEKRFTNIEEY